MPTAAKLVAAFSLAFASYGVAGVLLFRTASLQEQGISFGFFVVVGLIVGWLSLGPSAEQGYRSSWSGGIRAAFAVYIYCVAIAACHHVYQAMGYHAYNSVDDLVDGLFKKSVEYAVIITDWPVMCAAIFGGLLAGTFAAMAGRLWS